MVFPKVSVAVRGMICVSANYRDRIMHPHFGIYTRLTETVVAGPIRFRQQSRITYTKQVPSISVTVLIRRNKDT